MKRLYNFIPIVIVILGIPLGSVFAQTDFQVKGKVTSAEGPLPGVSIQIKNTNTGVTTDAQGEYTLQLKDQNATLIFSFIGFLTEEVPVNGRTVIDVLMMEDIATLSEGASTLGHTPVDLVNEVRSKRTTSTALVTVDLEFIYQERNREFVGENWHRNDMIRFQKFESSYGFKTDADPNKRLFPIPTTALQLNPNLDQNPGY